MFEDSSPQEVEAARVLEVLFTRLDAAEDRCDAFVVRPGSLLEADDRATAYDPISYQVRFFFVAAFDHVGMLRRALVDHGMPTVAAYPLVRAALEAVSQALWLTTGGTRRKRVFRALHRVWDSASFSEEALRHLDPSLPSSLPDLRRRLDELLSSAKVGQQSLDKRHASMTDIVVSAGRSVESRHFKPIDVWRLCSSMSHGNRAVSLMILENRLDAPVSETGGVFMVTTSFKVMATFVGVLVDVLDAALDDQDRLNA